MKSFGLYLLSLALLATLASCGKNNESGKSNNPYYSNNPYASNPYVAGFGAVSSPYSYNGVSVNSIVNANPCVVSGTPNQVRMAISQPVNLAPNILPANQIYVGVTSAGDVAVLAGNGTSQATFAAYICSRGVPLTTGVQPQLVDLAYGSYSTCSINPITRATLILPTQLIGQVPLYFRWLQGGSSLGQKFPFCQ